MRIHSTLRMLRTQLIHMHFTLGTMCKELSLVCVQEITSCTPKAWEIPDKGKCSAFYIFFSCVYYLCLPILLCNSWRPFSVVSLSGKASRLAKHDCWIWHIAPVVLATALGQCHSHCCVVCTPCGSQSAELQFLLQIPLAPGYDSPQPGRHSSWCCYRTWEGENANERLVLDTGEWIVSKKG